MRQIHFYLFALVMTLFCANLFAQKYEHQTTTGSPVKEHVKASNNYITKEYRFAGFSQIYLNGSADVVYEQREGKPAVEVYTSDNIMDLLEIYEKKGALHIGFKKGYKISYNELKIKVWSPTIALVSIAGSGEVKMLGKVNSDRLSLTVAGSGDIEYADLSCKELKVVVSGSGDIEGKRTNVGAVDISIAGSGDVDLEELNCSNLSATVTGSGEISLSGHGANARYAVTGSGDIDADELKIQRVEASITGSGDISCHAIDFLKARVTGSGSVGYRGTPQLDIPKQTVRPLK